MKKAIWITLAVIVIIQFIDSRLPQTAPPGPKELSVTEKMPSDVKELMSKACYDCHSMESRFPWYSHVAPVKWLVKSDILGGRRHVNFSDWGDYQDKQKVKKLDDIHEEVEKHDMPPSNYLLMHKEARLTDTDRQKIVAWADSTANNYLE